MLRISINFVLIAIIAGCTSTPTSPAESPIILKPTTLGQAATSEPATESPVIKSTTSSTELATIQEYPVPAGTHPHDVAPAPDGIVWYTAQHVGALGRLDPVTGQTRHIPLGSGPRRMESSLVLMAHHGSQTAA